MPIPKKKQRKIQRRAEQQAHRAFRPERQARRQDIRKIKERKERDLSQTHDAAAYLRNELDQAMQQAQNSGLKGRYLKQTLNELQAMKGDAKQMIPLEQQAIRQAYASPLATARKALTTVQGKEATEAEKAYAKRITTLKSVQAAQKKEKVDIRQEAKLAFDEGKLLVSKMTPEGLQRVMVGDPAALEEFAKAIGSREGVNTPQAVRAAMQQIRKQIVALSAGQAATRVGTSVLVPPSGP